MFKILVGFNLCLWRPLVVAAPGLLRVFLQQRPGAEVSTMTAVTAAEGPERVHPVRPPALWIGPSPLQPLFALSHAPTLHTC